MPKPIKALVEIEESAFGPVMNRLHNMPGIISFVPLLGDTKMEKEHKKANGHAAPKPAKRFETTAPKLMLKLLSEHKGPMVPREMAAAFERAGRSRTSYATVISDLKSAGLAQVGEGGGYTLTKKGRDKARYV